MSGAEHVAGVTAEGCDFPAAAELGQPVSGSVTLLEVLLRVPLVSGERSPVALVSAALGSSVRTGVLPWELRLCGQSPPTVGAAGGGLGNAGFS